MSDDSENKNTATNSAVKESSHETPVIATGDWRNQISEGLLWLNERAWPLAGVVLFVAVIYLHSFIHEEKVPMSIASPAIITALPILFALLLLSIGLLMGLLFSPTMMLFTPIKKKCSARLVDLLVKPGGYESGRFGMPLRIMGGWLSIPVIMGVMVGIIWLLSDKYKDATWVMSFLVLLSLPVAAFVFIRIFIKEESLSLRLSDVSSDFWVSVIVGQIPQFLLTIYVITLSGRIAHAYGNSHVVFVMCGVVGVVALCLIQLIGAKKIASVTQPEQSLATSFITGFIIVVLLGIYPPTASRLTGSMLQLTTSGGRACAVLTWTSNASVGVEAVRNSEVPGQSKSLRIFIDVDGYYLVRPIGAIGKPIYFVPRDIVSSIDDCPK